MTTVVWKAKQDIHMLTNTHVSPAEGNFCDESVNTLKPAIVEDYN
jgi:F420-0:gamma-glutamyl ligase-like protein